MKNLGISGPLLRLEFSFPSLIKEQESITDTRKQDWKPDIKEFIKSSPMVKNLSSSAAAANELGNRRRAGR